MVVNGENETLVFGLPLCDRFDYSLQRPSEISRVKWLYLVTNPGQELSKSSTTIATLAYGPFMKCDPGIIFVRL